MVWEQYKVWSVGGFYAVDVPCYCCFKKACGAINSDCTRPLMMVVRGSWYHFPRSHQSVQNLSKLAKTLSGRVFHISQSFLDGRIWRGHFSLLDTHVVHWTYSDSNWFPVGLVISLTQIACTYMRHQLNASSSFLVYLCWSTASMKHSSPTHFDQKYFKFVVLILVLVIRRLSNKLLNQSSVKYVSFLGLENGHYSVLACRWK